ncbi:hypothetical protein FE257_010951 [Aspergillus nanangensis]|uniref:Zn(2)-C6 fungal-type domain-containing protein n=1 Tax=Aspergillus nanangensis TaxID=2582783 RepID=A0AAD4GXB2_ASPNN|nr:hypothetical protein FE257_010951 [Aspergillus nanangensis]
MDPPVTPSYSQIACVGTGLSAIALGATLKRWYSLDDIRFFDRQSDCGGTWFINTYPGCACDVPSALYSFSWHPNPAWTKLMPSYKEIKAYQDEVIDAYQLRDKMTFSTQVQQCIWREEASRWLLVLVDLQTGRTFHHECQILFAATGQLVEPRPCDIPGADSFQGALFHSARWRHNVALEGKRVVVVGNGCTAAQIVPSIVNRTESLHQIVRAKHWIFPAANFTYPSLLLWIFRYIPLTLKLHRLMIFLLAENDFRLFPMTAAAAKMRAARKVNVERYMRATAPEKYHEVLIPDFDVGCKRRIFDPGYLRSLHNEKLVLTDARITEIVPDGVRTSEGFIPADVIVLATGFQTNQFTPYMEVRGKNGSLHEHWERYDGPGAYNCSAMSEFPNYFLLLGPNAATGHTSALMAAENSVNYALRVLKPVLSGEAVAVELNQDAEDEYILDVQKALRGRVWNAGCASWYLNSKGWNAMAYPWSQAHYWYRSLFPIWSHWTIKRVRKPLTPWHHRILFLLPILAASTAALVRLLLPEVWLDAIVAGLLPREGLYIDPLVSLLRNTIFHPVATILLATYVKLVPESLPSTLSQPVLYGAVLSAALWVNDWLSKWSHNNWTRDTRWDWRKEVVVVTGGSSGIGASVAHRLAEDGVRVAVVDIAPLTYRIDNKPISYFHCDLSDEAEIHATCQRIREQVGHPTVLLNNAGLTRGQPIANGTYRDNAITLQTNLLAPFLLTKEFLPHMIETNHGHIVNVSSFSAYMPPAGLADYAASKAGLVVLHEALGMELKYLHRSPKVRTSLAVLSFTETPLFKGELNQPGFLFPLIHVDTVGDAIVDTLYSGYGRTIYLPGVCGFFAGVRGAPEWLQQILRSGSRDLKVDFKGRQTIDAQSGRLIRTRKPGESRRRKVALACDPCRTRKARCDGHKPVCKACARRGLTLDECLYKTVDNNARSASSNEYLRVLRNRIRELEQTCLNAGVAIPAFDRDSILTENDENEVMQQTSGGVGQNTAQSLPSSTPMGDAPFHPQTDPDIIQSSPFELPSNITAMGDISTSVERNEKAPDEFFGSSSTASLMRLLARDFVRQPPAIITPNIPAASASISEPLTRTTLDKALLPPRDLADHLLACFWDRVYCLYPFFDRPSFQAAYENLWLPRDHPPTELSDLAIGLGSKRDSGLGSIVFICALNMMFALGCHFADIPVSEREAVAHSFFLRAKMCIGLDMLEIRTVGTVQTFLVTVLFLQSTPYPHRCWQSMGVACRLAQGLGLHEPQLASCKHPLELEIQRRTWHGCVMMDMFVSMTYGRPTMTSHLSSVPLPLRAEVGEDGRPSYMSFYIATIELYRILDNILEDVYRSWHRRGNTPPTASSTTAAATTRQARLDVIIELEQKLFEYASGLPSFLSWTEPTTSTADSSYDLVLQRQRNVLHARFLYLHLLLYRPIFTQLCTDSSTLPTAQSVIYASILAKCAAACVKAAINLVSLVHETYLTSATDTWWYNGFYTSTAGMVLIMSYTCAAIRDELSPQTIDHAWSKCAQILCDMKPFSLSARNTLLFLQSARAQVLALQPLAQGPVSLTEQTFNVG